MRKIGDVAGKLHTARSRNDQIALDLRLFVKEVISKTASKLRNLQQALLDDRQVEAKAEVDGGINATIAPRVAQAVESMFWSTELQFSMMSKMLVRHYRRWGGRLV